MTDKYFATRYSYDAGRKKVWRAIAGYLQRFIPLHTSVLEIGSGYCDFINLIAADLKVAVDINPQAQQFCSGDVKFYCTSIEQAALDESGFDVIFCSNLLEHFNDDELNIVIKKVYELLKSTGKLLIIQPNYYYCYRNYWDDFTHKKAFSHLSLCDFLVNKGFEIEVCKKRFLPFSFKSVFPKSYLLTKIYLKLFWKPFAKQMLVVARKT